MTNNHLSSSKCGASKSSPLATSFKSATEMQYVAFRPMEEVEIHGNDPKLLKFYEACGPNWLRGCVRATTFKSVKVAKSVQKYEKMDLASQERTRHNILLCVQ
ncbi:hypothetical protein AC1031_005882 [Aphanomyces cochlioides]|nr:hypothetical protein AC1031_005882 [Aphanomyces cochlioides]